MEYPFLLQDVFADPSIHSKIVLESPVENADQLFKIIVKPRMFERDERFKKVFQKIFNQGKVESYAEPAIATPTYERILSDIEDLKKDSIGKPNYLNALDEIRKLVLDYMKKNKLDRKHKLNGEFIDYLDKVAIGAVNKFKVSDKSNLYGWATTRSYLKDNLEPAPEKEEGYTIEEIGRLIESDIRLVCLSIADPNLIKSIAIALTTHTLANRKKEFKVEPSMLFVFDEAQEFIPAYDKAKGIEKECTDKVETLLRQGRKYGLGVCIATQRIAYLNTNALQQLHTYFVGPLPRPYDRNLVSSTFTIDQGILEKTLEFAPGEWLLSSYIATGIENVPIFIKADDAEEEVKRFLKD